MTNQVVPPLLGFLPAAGRGLRFGSSGYAKELFPLFLAGETADRVVEPRPICELALRAVRTAGAERCIVMISAEKSEVLRVLGNGAGLGLSLAYVVQPEPAGLPHAIRCARPWLGDADVALAMPDTVVLPAQALRELRTRMRSTGAQVMLGVFPVDEPERLGPVAMAADGRVLHVYDKPGNRDLMNSWAVVCWTKEFTDFCAAWDEQQEQLHPRERVLGHAFEAARAAGLRVYAHPFPAGLFLDIGTPRGLLTALAALSERGMLATQTAPAAPSPAAPLLPDD